MTRPFCRSIDLFDVSEMKVNPPYRNAADPERPFWLQRLDVFNSRGDRFTITLFLDDETDAKLEAEFQRSLQPLPLFEGERS